MTTVPEIRSAVEANLAEQLSAFAREFVADLEAQGRLVEAGGAGVLERLRTQVEAGQNCPEAYHAAVDTIVEDCGYPSEVAMRIATALNRKGLIPGDDVEPRHDHDHAHGPDARHDHDHDHAHGSDARHDHAHAPGPDLEELVPGDEDSEPRHDRAPAPVPDHREQVPGGEDPEPRHDRASIALPLVPPARGAIVLHLADRGVGRAMAEHGAAPVPQRVDGQVPRVKLRPPRGHAPSDGAAPPPAPSPSPRAFSPTTSHAWKPCRSRRTASG